MHPTESEMHPIYETLLNLYMIPNKKVSFVYRTKETFLRDAFLAECDARFVRDDGFA